MNTETITRIEREITQLEADRTQAELANDALIAAEENRKSGHTDIQAKNLQQLKAKKDSVMDAYALMRDKKAAQLAQARIDKATREAVENAEHEARAAKLKAQALRAFVTAGGLPADFDEHYKGILTARTVERMGQKNSGLVLPRI